MIRSIQRRHFLVLVPLLAGCGMHSMTLATYPELRVKASALRLELIDTRRRLEESSRPPNQMDRGDRATKKEALPKAFRAQAESRLLKLAGQGPPLTVQLQVAKADVTFLNDGRDDFTRFDVELQYRIISDGIVLLKGRGGAWNELPSEEANLKEQERFFRFTATQAFDNIFASEETLQKLNRQIAQHQKSRPAKN